MALTDALVVGEKAKELERNEANLEEAFETLVRQHREAIYRVAIRMTHRHEDADDLVQETFLRAYTSLQRFRGEASPATWLYRIVTNLALNLLRHRSRFQRAAVLFRGESESVTPPSVDQDETRRAVQAALEMLPPSQRIVVVLFDIEGLSAAQIAEILDIPEGTVRSRLHYARRHLRRRLSAFFEELDHASHVS